jgi:subtilisin family serine protease
MNNFKIILLSAVAFFAIAGCGTSKKVYDISAMAVKAPSGITKITPLKEDDLKRWSHLDIQKDTVPGMSVDKAYAELLKDKTGVKVIVGVVDSGVDIEHEDLKLSIWTNAKEIANNGIDDDKNGYIDDIHGWNFLGDIVKENLEYERILAKSVVVDETTFKKAQKNYDDKAKEAQQDKTQLENMLTGLTKADGILINHIGKSTYTSEEVNAIESQDNEIIQSKKIMKRMLSFGLSIPDLKAEIQKELDGSILTLKGNNFTTDYRKVVGDNPNDFKDNKYGNNNVMGPDKEKALHGTHVAGIIAQTRSNALGGDGVANNVEIMTVRAVPDGDEYDKDVALAIRYAVDNGAKVINTSFGKYFSPHKQWVYDAIKYAAKKDVLIVHSAGNESKDMDKEINYPNDYDGKEKEFTDNVLTIGALNFDLGDKVVANFSNYGTKNADVFAPGVKIYATTPKNTYKYLQGTSMASPNVAGVAALIRSYYPKLKASQVKHILMDSGVTIETSVMVGEETKESRSFASLSKSGKIVNAYNALLLADKMTKK